jgi:phosphatidylinositol glycan class V
VVRAGFVQSHYWNVGLLRYYEPKQAPNFALAAPMLTLCACAVYSYVAVDVRRVLTLGLGRHPPEAEAEAEAAAETGERVEGARLCESEPHGHVRRSARLRHRNVRQSTDDDDESSPRKIRRAPPAEVPRTGFHGDAVLPFIVHCAFMLLVAALVMHVQVRSEFGV